MSRAFGFILALAVATMVFGPAVANAEYANTVLSDPDLIAYYQLNETTGTTAVDSGSNAYDGTYYGSIPADNAAGPGPSDGFNGLDAANSSPLFNLDSINLPDSPFDLATITLSCFFKNSDTNKNHRLYCTSKNNVHKMTVALGGSTGGTVVNSLDVGLVSGLASKGTFCDSPLLTDGQWHHLVVVRHSDTVSETEVYIDGVLSTTTDVGEGHSITGALTRIGNREASTVASNLDWKGGIDEVAFFSRALTQEDVRALYAAAVPEPAVWMLLMGAAIVAFIRKAASSY